MGDEIEFTTTSLGRNQDLCVFYKVTSGSAIFAIKTSEMASIGLAQKPSSCNYWIVLNRDNKCMVQVRNKVLQAVAISNFTNDEDYTYYWISWHSDCIKLGRLCEEEPLLNFYRNDKFKLNYITFKGYVTRTPVHWRLIVPPISCNEESNVKGSKLHWVTSSDKLPEDALIGGFEKETLYIMRAEHNRSITPGKYVPRNQKGYLSWGGASNEKSECEILCGYNGVWVPTKDDCIPVGAVVGGKSEDNDEPLYVGRGYHKGHLIPGKVQLSHHCCYVPYNRAEVAVQDYEILVEPNKYVELGYIHKNMVLVSQSIDYELLNLENSDYNDSSDSDEDSQ